jgi:hypothetical protein
VGTGVRHAVICLVAVLLLTAVGACAPSGDLDFAEKVAADDFVAARPGPRPEVVSSQKAGDCAAVRLRDGSGQEVTAVLMFDLGDDWFVYGFSDQEVDRLDARADRDCGFQVKDHP